MQPVIFLKSQDIQPTFFSGYERQMEFGMTFGKMAEKLKTEYRLLLFGFPGTGKTLYPQALASNLNKNGSEYSLVKVKCNSLRIDSPKVVRKWINKIDRYLKHGQVVLVLDELDIFAQRRDESEYNVYNTATGHIMNILDERYPSTITLGITNNPYKLDVAVRDRFDYPIYFPISNSNIESILRYRGIPNPEQTAEQLRAIYTENQTNTSNRNIFKSMNFVNSIDKKSSNILSKMRISDDPKEMAIRLYLNSGIPISEQEVEDYEEENRFIINKSNMLLSYLFDSKID